MILSAPSIYPQQHTTCSPCNTKMQISLSVLPSQIPSISPFHQWPPYATLNWTLPKSSLQTCHVNPMNSLQGAGYLSAIGRAIEEEEYRKARAEVARKGVELEGYSFEGCSIGGHETCIVVPELKCAFDIGRCPSRAIHQNFIFITHAHLDHIGGLPMYVATRSLYNLKPPTVFVPPSIKDDVEKLFDIHRKMGQVELNLDLVALDVGETYEMRNDLVVRPFRTQHVIPSQGYIVYSVRKKLKKQYIHLKGKQIEKLKKSGVEITDIILSPEIAFTGDTTADYMLDPRNADALRAKILITEYGSVVPRKRTDEINRALLAQLGRCDSGFAVFNAPLEVSNGFPYCDLIISFEATFLDEGFGIEHAREHGHTHILEIIEHAKWIRNKAVLLTHFSSRYNIEDIRQAVSKLQSKVSAKVVPLTEGFRSMYSSS